MPELKVITSREFKPTREYKGTTITEDTGMNYVDVYFPDGTQKTMGYIMRDDGTTQWTPCHPAPQKVYDAIQEKINEARGGDSDPPYNMEEGA